jgi:hypothetical protein
VGFIYQDAGGPVVPAQQLYQRHRKRCKAIIGDASFCPSPVGHELGLQMVGERNVAE